MSIQVLEMTTSQLRLAVEATGQPSFRANQIADWVYSKYVTDTSAMTNLPASLTDELDILTSSIALQQVSTDGTIKLLLKLADGQHIETVLIPTKDRATACVSTQAGCGIGCKFCASGLGGLARNLTSGEILQQILHLQQVSKRRVSNVVFMGSGEPLANYDATIEATRAIIDPKRFGISARNVTISTVGLPTQIERLASEGIPITLAISLHAPFDGLREELIPFAAKTPLAEIITAAYRFVQSRNRRVTLEYILLAGVNDTKYCAEALTKLCKQLHCNVNLIRFNPVESLPYQSPSADQVTKFAQWLTKAGVNAFIRKPRGLDIAGACGQLRNQAAQETSQDETK